MGPAPQPEPDPAGGAAGGITPLVLPGATATVGPPVSGQVVGYVAGAASHGNERLGHYGTVAGAAALAAAGPVMAIDLIVNRHQIIAGLVVGLLAATSAAWLLLLGRGRLRTGHPVLGRGTVRRCAFVLRPVSGGQVTCVVYGELDPDVALRHGHVLRVTGRQRSGRFVVRRIDVLATPAGPVIRTVRTRWTTALATNPWVDRVAWSVAAVTVAYALVVLTAVVR